MKHIIYITLVLIFSCNKENTDDEQETLIGKWQLIETCGGDGGGNWICDDVVDGYILQFNDDNTFTKQGNFLGDCFFGSFTYDDINLTSFYTNEECASINEVFIINYEFIEKKLSLNYMCDEGCSDIFKRINIDE